MELDMTLTGNSAIITIKGHVDEQGAEEMNEKLSVLDLKALSEIVFDFKEVRRIGSAGIGQLLLVYKNLSSSGGSMTVKNLSHTMYELFQGLKLDTLFQISRS